MNLKNSIVSILVIAIIATITLATAATIMEYLYPSIGTITEASATIYFDGDPYTSGDTFNWSSMMRGYTYFTVLKVVNTGGVPFNVTLAIELIPLGISYEWTANKTIVSPGSFAEANLEITIAPDFPLGTNVNLGTYYIRLLEVTK